MEVRDRKRPLRLKGRHASTLVSVWQQQQASRCASLGEKDLVLSDSDFGDTECELDKVIIKFFVPIITKDESLMNCAMLLMTKRMSHSICVVTKSSHSLINRSARITRS